jgi:hypothetical protein
VRQSAAFYARLGVEERFHDDGWMVLARAPLKLEFFPWPAIDPRTTIASCCIQVENVDDLHAAFSAAGLSQADAPIRELDAPVRGSSLAFAEMASFDIWCSIWRFGTRLCSGRLECVNPF